MPDAIENFSPGALAMLKANLGFFGSDLDPAVETWLKELLNYAFEDFRDMRILLKPGNVRDDMSQVTHAAWMYRSGVKGEGKHEMLKSIIRNRQVSDALAEKPCWDEVDPDYDL